jgi:hypothetical protein
MIYYFSSIKTWRLTFGVCITPNAEKVSNNNFSSTSGSRLPINKFAPTSRFF